MTDTVRVRHGGLVHYRQDEPTQDHTWCGREPGDLQVTDASVTCAVCLEIESGLEEERRRSALLSELVALRPSEEQLRRWIGELGGGAR
jgi:hypothetical protein